MKHFTQVVLLIFSCILVACSVSPFTKRSAASCPKKKSRKVKTYRVKKNKKANRSYAYSSGGSSSSKSTTTKSVEKPKPAPKPVEQVKQEPKQVQKPIAQEKTQPLKTQPPKKEEPKQEEVKQEKEVEPREEPPIPSIADAKDTAPEPEPEIEIKGQVVDLEKGDFEFEEDIKFKNISDELVNTELAKKKLDKLIEILKNNKDVEVTIIGNAATIVPNGELVYGDSEDALNQGAKLNGKNTTIKKVMLYRAKVVYDLLKREGVSTSQMKYTTGSFRKWEQERVVSFILRKK